jgi:predicted DNA-binding transcriptional regulator AlpA
MLFSTHQVAKKLRISVPSLYRYIELKKLPAPKPIRVGDRDVRTWTEQDIEHVRQLLPKIANGRKTRYQKKLSAVSTQQSAKAKKKTQARVPAPQKRKPKKKR